MTSGTSSARAISSSPAPRPEIGSSRPTKSSPSPRAASTRRRNSPSPRARASDMTYGCSAFRSITMVPRSIRARRCCPSSRSSVRRGLPTWTTTPSPSPRMRRSRTCKSARAVHRQPLRPRALRRHYVALRDRAYRWRGHLRRLQKRQRGDARRVEGDSPLRGDQPA